MHRIYKQFILIVACLGILSGCGGSDAPLTSQAMHSQSMQARTKAIASDYQTVVQELYISYFGRPADPSGLANFENSLLSANAPTDIQSLSAAYATNTAIQQLIDSFGTSAESIALYGASDPTSFVNAVFQNVLNRTPNQIGLNFWVSSITNHTLSQGDAALSIMAGALTNTTPQGLLDAQLINNRLAVAGYFSAQVTGQNALSAYAGAGAAARARGMLGGVNAATDTTGYQPAANSAILALLLHVEPPVIVGAMDESDYYEGVGYNTSANNQIVAVQATLVVPAEPPPSGTLYLPIGLLPAAANFGAIGYGNLESVLTWGQSCAPGNQPSIYSSWWISALYVNTGDNPECQGSQIMAVGVGDTLNITMTLNGTVWTQNIIDMQTQQSVNYSIDLHGQKQNTLGFGIQGVGQNTAANVNFTNISFTLASPEATACFPTTQASADIIANPVVSSDQQQCQVSSATLGTNLLAPINNSNSVRVTLDGGTVPNQRIINRAFVDVTLCIPGTSQCETVDHVILDTASTGLRIMPGVLDNAFLTQLPALRNTDGDILGECAAFAAGITWGGVRSADVKLGGETAPDIPFQTVGEHPAGYSSIPTDCTSQGADVGSVAAQGGNGILGISIYTRDCVACSFNIVPGTYYSCTSTSCLGDTIPFAAILPNPVSHFAKDNNGIVLSLPAVGLGGAANISGTLTFGIGTQSNNNLTTQTIYPMNFIDNTSISVLGTQYKSNHNLSGFMDTGSPALYFSDSSISACTSSTWAGLYCPSSPVTIIAQNENINRSESSVGITIESPINLGVVDAANVGGTFTDFDGNFATEFDWGLPFFFGRTAYNAFQDAPTPAGPGPYWAY